jgi:metal-dependent amidase/aminoacylase/carboxypeptidase family protein
MWQDLDIKAHRPQGGRFGVQMTNIAVNHPAEPLYQGIDDPSNRHTDHGGPTKNVIHDAYDLHGTFRSPDDKTNLAG